MLRALIDPTFILVLFVLVRSADILIGAVVARDYLRIVAYGVLCLLSLIYIILKVLL